MEIDKLFRREVLAAIIIGAFIIGFFIYFASIPNPSPQQSSSQQNQVLKKFYTKSVANIRTCPSISCSIGGQFQINTEFELPYSSIEELTEWVGIPYKDSVTNEVKTGYMNKVVFSSNPVVVVERTIEKEKIIEKPTPQIDLTSIIEKNLKFVPKISCFWGNGSIDGSGIIFGSGIDNQGNTRDIILTNYHITQDSIPTKYMHYPCWLFHHIDNVVYSQGWYEGQPVGFTSGLVNWDTMKYFDFSFIQIMEKRDLTTSGCSNNPACNKAASTIVFDTPKLCKKEQIKVGKELVIMGYPGIGGQGGLTATEGIISGFDNADSEHISITSQTNSLFKDVNDYFNFFIITNAKMEHGNSGGAAFLKEDGCLAGMATYVNVGSVESLGRLINIPILYEYFLSSIWPNHK